MNLLTSTRLPPLARQRRRIDVRPFPGRDRSERVMHWLRAHFPRAQSWSEPSLRQIALGLIAEAEIIE
jgi:hypothetical protein